jgi:predicted O-linked N-acetylglucosamine transferase (SPINDLY family)
VLEVLEPMMALAAAVPGVAVVTPRGGTLVAEAGPIDCHVALMSLPAMLGRAPSPATATATATEEPSSLPADGQAAAGNLSSQRAATPGPTPSARTPRFDPLVRLAPAVHVDPSRIASWRERLLGHGWQPRAELAVGWVWAGNPNVKSDSWRSPRLPALQGLLEVPGVRWFALQKGDGHRDIEALAASPAGLPAHLVDLDAEIADFTDTAAVIANLDLVITSDTSVAHLAGCLGKPVWVTMPWQRDWRYGMDTTRNAWYPSMTLFRQPVRGDWAAVQQAVCQALAAEVAALDKHRELPSLDQDQRLRQAFDAMLAGQNTAARRACIDVLIGHPRRPDAWALLGAVERRTGDEQLAAEAYQRAIDVGPTFSDAWRNLGLLRKSQGRHQEALELLTRACQLAPLDRGARSQRSDVLRLLGRNNEALAAADDALVLSPHDLEACLHRANALVALGRFDGAIATYRGALQHHPASLDIHYNLGIALQRAERGDEAIPYFEQVLDALFDGHGAQAGVAGAAGEPDVAAPKTRLTPSQSQLAQRARYSLGLALQSRGEPAAAAAQYRRLLVDTPDHFSSLYNLAAACLALGQHERALAAYERCQALQPEHVSVALDILHLRQQLCDWDHLPDAAAQRALVAACAAPPAGQDVPSPFALLALPVGLSDADLAPVARAYAAQISQRAGAPLPAVKRAPGRPRRLRLAYASCDFHNHATMHLMRGVFSRHDRERFQVTAYSWGPDDGSHYREQLLKDVDHVEDVTRWTDARIAAQIRRDGVDVLVDLKGYTRDSRPGVFARRPAPLQLSWLGYPGAAGADFFDATVADTIVTPPEVRGSYTEGLALLPHSYQCTDGEQPIARTGLTRKACGLPERAPVLACFCTHYKIDAEVFAVWMRLLSSMPGAVLWLMDGAPVVRDRLRQRARAAGVAPQRLVFAPLMAKPQHLERLALADLVLDTQHYNGHTTASDALWAGVPVLSVAGQAFAGRVGASLLRAAGLPQGATPDLPAYEAQARRLLRHPRELLAWRRQLASARPTAPLWDTAGFVRDFQSLVDRCWAERFGA